MAGNYAMKVPTRDSFCISLHRPKTRLDALGIIESTTTMYARYIYPQRP